MFSATGAGCADPPAPPGLLPGCLRDNSPRQVDLRRTPAGRDISSREDRRSVQFWGRGKRHTVRLLPLTQPDLRCSAALPRAECDSTQALCSPSPLEVPGVERLPDRRQREACQPVLCQAQQRQPCRCWRNAGGRRRRALNHDRRR